MGQVDKAASQALHWWQTRWFVAAMALVAAIPLVWPDVPPLVDLPGHMARYRVQMARNSVPWLNDWYDFQWQLIGNLGFDLLVEPLAPILGLEGSVKLLTLLIPVLTAVGLLWIAREVHGRIPPTALFALPLIYSHPFHFGFVNFALSMALALNAFALWLRLGRTGHVRLRAIVFVPLGALIWLCHTFGWGTLGVLAFSAELIRQHDLRKGWIKPWILAAIHCLPLAPPLLLVVLWRTGHVSGQTTDWFNWQAKILWVLMVLRDRWMPFDVASLVVILMVLFKSIRDPKLRYSRNLAISALFLLAVFLVLPRIVFGSAYADMRLVPFMLAIGVVAIRPRPGTSFRHAATVAAIGLAFFGVRIAATTWSFALYDRDYGRQLAALDHVPEGAKLLTFVGETCYNEWRLSRLQHIPGMAMVRRLAYTNDQWSMAGAQLLTVKYPARGWSHDPSQIVTDVKCPREYWRPISVALARFPRKPYDYLWVVNPPPYDRRLERGLIPVWRDGPSAVFRIDHDVPAASLNADDLGPYPDLLQRLRERIRRERGS